jgi:hypothetical protein
LRQGVRVAVDQKINSTRFAARTGAAIPDVGFNRAKLEAVLGPTETAQLARALQSEQAIADTNGKLFAGSQTEPRRQAVKSVEVRGINPISAGHFGLPIFAEMGGLATGHGGLGPAIGGGVAVEPAFRGEPLVDVE